MAENGGDLLRIQIWLMVTFFVGFLWRFPQFRRRITQKFRDFVCVILGDHFRGFDESWTLIFLALLFYTQNNP